MDLSEKMVHMSTDVVVVLVECDTRRIINTRLGRVKLCVYTVTANDSIRRPLDSCGRKSRAVSPYYHYYYQFYYYYYYYSVRSACVGIRICVCYNDIITTRVPLPLDAS